MNENKIKIIGEETIRYMSIEFLGILIPIIGIEVLFLDNSLVAFATALSTAGYLVFSYFAGSISDKWNRKKTVIISLFILSLLFGVFSILISFKVLNKLNYFLIIIQISLILVIIETTMTSWTPDIFAGKSLSKINSLIQFLRSISNLIAPFLIGISIKILYLSNTITLISILILIAAILIFRVKTNGIKFNNENIKKEENKENTINIIKYIFKNITLRTIIFTTSTINFSISMYLSLLVIFLTKNLKFDVSLMGLLISISGLGAIIGSIIAPKLIERFGVIKTMVFAPIIPSFGLLFLSFSFGKFKMIIFVIGAIFFLASRSIGSISRVTVQQTILPSNIRGKATGIIMTLTWGMIPLGAIFAGILCNYIDVQKVIMISGILLILSNTLMIKNRLVLTDK